MGNIHICFLARIRNGNNELLIFGQRLNIRRRRCSSGVIIKRFDIVTRCNLISYIERTLLLFHNGFFLVVKGITDLYARRCNATVYHDDLNSCRSYGDILRIGNSVITLLTIVNDPNFFHRIFSVIGLILNGSGVEIGVCIHSNRRIYDIRIRYICFICFLVGMFYIDCCRHDGVINIYHMIAADGQRIGCHICKRIVVYLNLRYGIDIAVSGGFRTVVRSNDIVHISRCFTAVHICRRNGYALRIVMIYGYAGCDIFISDNDHQAAQAGIQRCIQCSVS